MPTPRLPLEKAKASGAFKKFPERYKPRVAPPSAPLGHPSAWLKGAQREVWESFREEMPWLKEGHRSLVEIASVIRARLVTAGDKEVGVQALNLLRMCLGQMGGTPADETKVSVQNDGKKAAADPAADYFN